MSAFINKVIRIILSYAYGIIQMFLSKPVLFLMIGGAAGLVFYGVGTWLHHYNIGQLMKGYKLDSLEKIAAPFLQIFGVFIMIAAAVLLYFTGAYDGFFSIFN